MHSQCTGTRAHTDRNSVFPNKSTSKRMRGVRESERESRRISMRIDLQVLNSVDRSERQKVQGERSRDRDAADEQHSMRGG